MLAVTKRKVDELGRIVLPIELRTNLSIESGDSLDICTDERGNIILHKSIDRCVFCRATSSLTLVMDKCVCLSCKNTINNT
ncbi:MAG TPA: AbrB/MazE/SpoVT family DNA-binding domain-containing protein [Methylomusa anaerophila]|jgi:transcriptional pleiotropic regulator of transition state genes|uniref:Transition state regulatory protein AbrB n=1 Tax=Methylomusa anaerophila TaxID=1930071 RepID=A0A348AN01_9FIRM|nr:AbrB/MazE/SpoVT family DNA-binding domain-containing protein [Methylomusa anaerophila]BBB92449.1 transition state regulatory protein AbrB [Methylomusa anaerophila]HML87701.1 AbrB/MazE/SpoVT family DNA-binding domain-containing protein [Methylomusa anaerophila]